MYRLQRNVWCVIWTSPCFEIRQTFFTPRHFQVQKLWLSLYNAIAILCVDGRPSVRKSAGQTLFGTISAHGSSLDAETWRQLFWNILFPILDNAERATENPESGEKKSNNFLVHHSRDTSEKQWAETKRLTLQVWVVIQLVNLYHKLYGIKALCPCLYFETFKELIVKIKKVQIMALYITLQVINYN